MTEAWVKFANGEEPWEKFGEKKRWMIFKETGAVLKTREEDVDRDYDRWDALHEHGIVPEFSSLSDELCIRRTELLTRVPAARSKTVPVPLSLSHEQEIGVL